ncbi:MAG: copper transporter [Mycobacterium sp.]
MRTARHRVFWLAAVFFALALGLVAGSGVFTGATLPGPGGPDAALQQRVAGLEAQNKSLSEKLLAADQFDARMSGRIVRDILDGTSVVLFRTPDAQDSDVDAVARLVGRAGGKVTGTIGLSREFVGGDSAQKLGSVVDSPIVPAGTRLNTALTDPAARAGDLAGSGLLINRDPRIAPMGGAARATVLGALRDAGLLTYDSAGAADTAVVVTGGALPDGAGSQGVTVARFAAALAPHGSGVVLAGREGSSTGAAAVAVTRGDAALDATLSTVDDIGSEAGRITAVLALQNMVAGGQPGRYGVGAGAAVTVQ